jgi:hypothetical protein
MAQAPHELPPPMPKDPHITSLAAVPGMADQSAGHGLRHQDRRSNAPLSPVLGADAHAS